MKEPGNWRFRVIALIVLTGLSVTVGACSARSKSPAHPLDALREKVDQVVQEPERAQRMGEAIARMEDGVEDLLTLTEATAGRLRALMADYSSDRGEFDALFQEHLARREIVVGRMLAAHLELKELATPEEWRQLAKTAREVADDVQGNRLLKALQD